MERLIGLILYLAALCSAGSVLTTPLYPAICDCDFKKFSSEIPAPPDYDGSTPPVILGAACGVVALTISDGRFKFDYSPSESDGFTTKTLLPYSDIKSTTTFDFSYRSKTHQGQPRIATFVQSCICEEIEADLACQFEDFYHNNYGFSKDGIHGIYESPCYFVDGHTNIKYEADNGDIECPNIVSRDTFNNEYVIQFVGVPFTMDGVGEPVNFHDRCPMVGNWATWSTWGKCIGSCNTGWQRRTRTCINGFVGSGSCEMTDGEIEHSSTTTIQYGPCDLSDNPACYKCPDPSERVLDLGKGPPSEPLVGGCSCTKQTGVTTNQYYVLDKYLSGTNIDSYNFGTNLDKVVAVKRGKSIKNLNFEVREKNGAYRKFFDENFGAMQVHEGSDFDLFILENGVIFAKKLQFPVLLTEDVEGNIMGQSIDNNFMVISTVFQTRPEYKTLTNENLLIDSWCLADEKDPDGEDKDGSIVQLSPTCTEILGMCNPGICPASADNDYCLCNKDKAPTCSLSSGTPFLLHGNDDCGTCGSGVCNKKKYTCTEEGPRFTFESCDNDCFTTCEENLIYTEWVTDEKTYITNCVHGCGDQSYMEYRQLRENIFELECNIPKELYLQNEVDCGNICCGHEVRDVHTGPVTPIPPDNTQCSRTISKEEKCEGGEWTSTGKTGKIDVPCDDNTANLCDYENVVSCIASNSKVIAVESCKGITRNRQLNCHPECAYGRFHNTYICKSEIIVDRRESLTDRCGTAGTTCTEIDSDHGCFDLTADTESEGDCVSVDGECMVMSRDDGTYVGTRVTRHCEILSLGLICGVRESVEECTLPTCPEFSQKSCCTDYSCGHTNNGMCSQPSRKCWDSQGVLFLDQIQDCCGALDECAEPDVSKCPPCDSTYPACITPTPTICKLDEADPCKLNREKCSCDNFDCTLSGFILDELKMTNMEKVGVHLPQGSYGDDLMFFVGNTVTPKCQKPFKRGAEDITVSFKFNDLVTNCDASIVKNVFKADVYIDTEKIKGSDMMTSRIHFAAVQCKLPDPLTVATDHVEMSPRRNPIIFQDVKPEAKDVKFELAKDPFFTEMIDDTDVTSNMLFIESMVYARVKSDYAVTVEECSVTDLADSARSRLLIKDRCITEDMKNVFMMEFTKIEGGTTEFKWKNFFFRDNLEDRQQLQYKCFVTNCQTTPCQPTEDECAQNSRRRRSIDLTDTVAPEEPLPASSIEFWVEAFRFIETLNRAKVAITKTHHADKVILVLDWVNNCLFSLTLATLVAFVILFYKRNVDEETKTIRLFEKTFYYGGRRSRDENSNRSSHLPVQVNVQTGHGVHNPAFKGL